MRSGAIRLQRGLVPLSDHHGRTLMKSCASNYPAIPRDQICTPHMIAQKSGFDRLQRPSVSGLKSGASGHPYGASKAGVISLVQTTPIRCLGPACASTRCARPDRDWHAPASSTYCEIARTSTDRANSTRSSAPASRMNSRDWIVPRQRRGLLRQRPGDPGRRADGLRPYAGKPI